MGRICWGVEGAREELESATDKIEKVFLDVVEIPDQENRFFYEVRMQPTVAVVEIGSGVKNCDLATAWARFPEEYHIRRRLSSILGTPDTTYKRIGEKVLAGLGTGEFTKPIEEDHLSPLDELLLIRSALECAYTIGFSRISFIGRTETTQNSLRQALKELTECLKSSPSAAYHLRQHL